MVGINHHKAFRFPNQVLEIELGRAARNSGPLSMLMCDIDFFKAYNDKFGHVSGDFCIKRVAAVLTEELRRPGDFVARYGGEEFAIVLPETDLPGALLVAEKCRAHVEGLAIPQSVGKVGSVTISVGACAVVSGSRSTSEQLNQCADGALYAAKAEGRNRVQSASVQS